MESKAQVRRRHRAQRALLSEDEILQRGRGLSRVLAAEVAAGALVAAYMPMRGEPDVLPFLRAHLRGSGQVCMPVVADAQDRILQWVLWSEEAELHRSPLLPVMEPAGERIPTSELRQRAADQGLTMLVPALALDRRGGRLGQGGGFYDTMFDQHLELSQHAQLLAVVYAEEVLDSGSFPVETHDLRVRRAATQSQMLRLSDPTENSV